MKINLDNPIICILSRIFDVCLTTVYFVLCSLPVITFGAAFSAMEATLIAIIQDEYSGVTEKFFESFRDSFKQSTLVWIVAMLVGMIVFINIRICWGIEQNSNTVLAAMRGITVFCTCFYLSMTVYTFAGISKYVVTIRQALNNAFVWTFRKMHWTILLICTWSAILLSVYLAWIWAFPFVALGLYIQALILTKAFGLEINKQVELYGKENSNE